MNNMITEQAEGILNYNIVLVQIYCNFESIKSWSMDLPCGAVH